MSESLGTNNPQDLEELENHMNDKNGEKRHVMSLPAYGILGCFSYILDNQRVHINFLFEQLGDFICGQLQPHRCDLSQKKRKEEIRQTELWAFVLILIEGKTERSFM